MNLYKYNILCLGKKRDFLKSRKTIAFNYKIIGYRRMGLPEVDKMEQ